MFEKKKSDLIKQIDEITELGNFSKYFELDNKYNNDDVKNRITEKVKDLIKTEINNTKTSVTLNNMEKTCKDETSILELLECLKKTTNLYFRSLKDDKKLKDNLKKKTL
jgi:hypothetical protein